MPHLSRETITERLVAQAQDERCLPLLYRMSREKPGAYATLWAQRNFREKME
jgi:hypothetical protein